LNHSVHTAVYSKVHITWRKQTQASKGLYIREILQKYNFTTQNNSLQYYGS